MKLLSIAITFLLSSVGLVNAAAPSLINYQGYLVDELGNPLSGDYSIAFSIWDAESAGTQIWTETHASVTVTEGSFSVILGSVAPVTFDLFADSVRYLQVSVGGEDITPRTRLVSVPYAHHVGTIDGATSGVIAGPLIIKPDDFDSLGNGIVVLNNNGNPQLAISIDAADVASVAIIEPEDSKANQRAAGSRVIELNRDGVFLFGATEADTNAVIRPDGSIRAINTISVGANNTNPGDYANVLGFNNSATGDSATVSGGSDNDGSGNYSVIGGGYNNEAGNAGTVSGGSYNKALGEAGAIGGGGHNTTGVAAGTVAGGWFNESSEQFSTVGGGLANTSSGISSAVPGGEHNDASGNYSFAAGRRAKANHAGCLVWADSTNSDFGSTGPNQFLIRAGGGMGINTDSPVADLTIDAGNDNDKPAIHIEGGNKDISWAPTARLQFGQWDGTTFTERVRFDHQGDVGIGLGGSDPSERLQVNGNICYTGSIAACSDVRFKTDISNLQNSLEKVMKLRGVNYRWRRGEFPQRDFEEGNQIGFIAQELETLFPEMVMTDSEGYKSVDYGRLTAVLVEAIKELAARVERLESQRQTDSTSDEKQMSSIISH